MQTPANSGSTSDQILARVRGQVAPAFAFAESYLRLLSEELGLGALAVWFGAEGIEHYISGKSNKSKEFEWQDSLSDLLHTTTRLGPPGQSAFCATLRKHAEADRRCHECDAKWIARTRKSGRSWAYECHAGLSEVIAPIEVKGKRIGEIMGGQLASTEKLPRGFENVWQRVKDIKGLDRSRLEKAFAQVTVVDQAALRRIHTRLKTAARGLGALIESVVDLMSREALLGQVRSYAERDFASFALTQRDASIDEIASRAKALGFSETPSVVIVAQPDRTSRALLENRNRQTDPTLRDLFEAAQELLRNEPNSLVCSIRPGELLILLSPRRTRNPSLAHLRVQEIMERLRNTLDSKCAVPLMLGVSNYDAPIISLAKAYEEAHANMGKDVLSSMAPDPTIETQTEQVLSRMTELGSEVRRTIRNTDRSALESALQAQLRLVRGCPEDNNNARQCLFTQMVLNLLSALRTISNNDAEIMHIETRYALAMPTLRTANDMIEWFFAHLLPLADRTLLEPSAKSNQIVLKACDLAARQLSHPLAREEVAGALGLSGTYFGKIFRAQTGITFREFMKRLRISKAQSLLLLPGKSVAETAVEVGYSTTAAFSRGFEQVCGASPTAYRTNPHAFPRITLPEKLKV